MAFISIGEVARRIGLARSATRADDGMAPIVLIERRVRGARSRDPTPGGVRS